MRSRMRASFVLPCALSAACLAGCETLSSGQAGAFGGMGTQLAAAGIVTDPTSHPVSTLLGGSLGFGGGYVVGVSPEKLDGKARSDDRDDALRANDRAERNPAEVEDVAAAQSADVNADGFVTLDEIIAMERAGLSDEEEIARLRGTGEVFELSTQQERYLEDRGISLAVIRAIEQMGGPSR